MSVRWHCQGSASEHINALRRELGDDASALRPPLRQSPVLGSSEMKHGSCLRCASAPRRIHLTFPETPMLRKTTEVVRSHRDIFKSQFVEFGASVLY